MGELPRVLLLGDSIRQGYQPWVAKLLRGRATVVGPEENCQTSAYTLEHLHEWIEQLGEPDIVHWNNGIHDAGHNPNRKPVQYSIQTYVGNLEAILERLRKVTTRVIWATTTPVHPERRLDPRTWSWRPGEIEAYNEAACRLMARHSVPINDLYSVVWKHIDEFMADDKLHLSEAGQRACAKTVADKISEHLDSPL